MPPHDRLLYLYGFDLLCAPLTTLIVKATSTTETVKFTSKGHVVIPARLRRQFQIEDGTKASVTTTPDGILIRKPARLAQGKGSNESHDGRPQIREVALMSE